MPKTQKRRGPQRLSKAACQFRHAARRANLRYGLVLHKDRYLQLCKLIQDGRGTCLGRQSNRLSVWRIEVVRTEADALLLEEKRTEIANVVCGLAEVKKVSICNVVYDKQRHRIVTFLPEGITNAKGVSLIGDEVVEVEGEGGSL